MIGLNLRESLLYPPPNHHHHHRPCKDRNPGVHYYRNVKTSLEHVSSRYQCNNAGNTNTCRMVRVRFTLEQAKKAQRGSRGIAVPFL